MYLELSFSTILLAYGKFRMALNGRENNVICTLHNTVNIDLVL